MCKNCISDREFVSFNVFAHAIENNTYFLVRARESNPRSMLATIKLPDSPEYDIIFIRYVIPHFNHISQSIIHMSGRCSLKIYLYPDKVHMIFHLSHTHLDVHNILPKYRE